MSVKLRFDLLLSQFRIKARRLVNRLPRRIRALGPSLLGGIIGLIGGIPGFLIGLLLGYLVGELFGQFFHDRKILDYFENPSAQQFNEGEPGLAAWCALGILVSSRRPDSFPEKILREVILGASCAFTGPGADPLLMEHFSRLALSRKDSLNPDLLAESLAARRISSGTGKDPIEDLLDLGQGLNILAGGEEAKALARQICLILDPAMEGESEDLGTEERRMPKDPWKILGLPPGTAPREIKNHYRKLAKQFHPDKFIVLDEKHREIAAQAFMAIKEAYKEVMGE